MTKCIPFSIFFVAITTFATHASDFSFNRYVSPQDKSTLSVFQQPEYRIGKVEEYNLSQLIDTKFEGLAEPKYDQLLNAYRRPKCGQKSLCPNNPIRPVKPKCRKGLCPQTTIDEYKFFVHLNNENNFPFETVKKFYQRQEFNYH